MKNWTVLVYVEMPDEKLKKISERLTKNFNSIGGNWRGLVITRSYVIPYDVQTPDDFSREDMDDLLAELKSYLRESDKDIIGVTYHYVEKPTN